jgi:NTE family protein
VALSELDTYLRTRSIAVASFVGGIIDPFASRLEKLAESYDAHLFHGLKLGDLKAGPRLYLNATNLTTGNMFFFITGEDKDVVMGDHELKTADASGIPLCQAVAASSAFPPVFPPMPIHAKIYPPAEPYDYITLCDGGVYDNMGINPTMLDRNALDYVIISDAARPLGRLQDPVDSGSMVLRAALDIMMNQVRGLQFDRVQTHHLAGKGPKPMWFSINSTEGEAQAGDGDLASAVGTNLKSLSTGEMNVLLRHAGALLKARIAEHAPELKAT